MLVCQLTGKNCFYGEQMPILALKLGIAGKPAYQHAGKPANQKASKLAFRKTSKPANQKVSKPAYQYAIMQVSLQVSMLASLFAGKPVSRQASMPT